MQKHTISAFYTRNSGYTDIVRYINIRKFKCRYSLKTNDYKYFIALSLYPDIVIIRVMRNKLYQCYQGKKIEIS